jgi:hypothetical protein
MMSSTEGLSSGSVESIHWMSSWRFSEYLSGILSIFPAIIFFAKAKWFDASKGGLSAIISYKTQPADQISVFSL